MAKSSVIWLRKGIAVYLRSMERLNDPQIADLRARRGVGADAMDDLRQLFEIKMASGLMPNEVTLTQAQALAAQAPDFFLAIVKGLEDGNIPLSVRFTFDPYGPSHSESPAT